MVSPSFAQKKSEPKDDVVVLKNGDRMTGEIKKLEHGILYFKPDYVIDSAEIDWTQVEQLDSKQRFKTILTDGTVHIGLIRKEPADDTVTFTEEQTVVRVMRSDVIVVVIMKNSVWRQINGSVDYGFSYESGNNQTQSSLGANASYYGERNNFGLSLSSSLNSQTTGTNTVRHYVSSDYSRRFSENWYATVLGSLLKSSQQELDLRTTLGGGFGRTLIRTANTRSALFGGMVVSRERYVPTSGLQPTGTNAEAVLGLDFSHFRFKSFDFGTDLLVYPSLSTFGRVRMSSESNLRWEFIKNVFWNLRLYENFDSHPPVNAPNNDFGLTNSIGWKF